MLIEVRKQGLGPLAGGCVEPGLEERNLSNAVNGPFPYLGASYTGMFNYGNLLVVHFLYMMLF